MVLIACAREYFVSWAVRSTRPSHVSARHRRLRVHTVVATLTIERLRRLCRFRRTAFGLVIG